MTPTLRTSKTSGCLALPSWHVQSVTIKHAAVRFIFLPEGSIIPFGAAMEWSDEKPAETIHLYIYAGKDADFQLYEDEGINYNYEKGLYATIDIHYDDAQKKVTLHHRKGSFPGMPENRKFNIVWVTGNHSEPLSLEHPKGTMVEYTGQTVSVSLVPEP